MGSPPNGRAGAPQRPRFSRAAAARLRSGVARLAELIDQQRSRYRVQVTRAWLESRLYARRATALRRRSHNGLWLFCERGDTAEDNAFHLFSYVRAQHPERDVCFVASRAYPDSYERVARLGPVVEPGTPEHKVAYLAATHIVSTHARGMVEPWRLPFTDLVPRRFRDKPFLYLDHGVTKDDVSEHEGATAPHGRFDLYCAVGAAEAEFLRNRYGYARSVVRETGLARYDALQSSATAPFVLFMPTWRQGSVAVSWDPDSSVTVDHFVASDYYRALDGLLNDRALLELLRDLGRRLVFYPHFEVQQYLDTFTVRHPDLAAVVERHTVRSAHVQDLLKRTELLITDYSSVAFDIGYLGRPVVHYQFDEEAFRRDHYRPGYFDYRRDGFGPVVTTNDAVVTAVREAYAADLVVGSPYAERAATFFRYRDDRNCERIYDAICSLDASPAAPATAGLRTTTAHDVGNVGS